MTVSNSPWQSPRSTTPAVELAMLPAPVLHALGSGRQDDAVERSPVVLTPYLLGGECRGVWRMRSEQITREPADHPWITRVIVASAAAVGAAGFHGPPDERGMVEIGYRVDPAHRRHGYARSALETLLATARDDARVEVVRATVGPHNTASRALVDQYGFEEVGEQWDEEDGLEIILEIGRAALQR